MLQRLKVTLIGSSLLAGYLWTGAVTRLWIAAQSAGHPAYGATALHQRPMRGYARAGANVPLFRAMSVYGHLSAGPILGPTTGAFLRGLGVGIDPGAPDYDARCRAALEGVAAQSGFNPWREHARLELAHLMARPGSMSPRAFSLEHDAAGSSWVTLGLIDGERWWLTHEAAGPDPARALELCNTILQGRPGRPVMADALHLKADLAAEYWDFASQEAQLRDLVESCPASRHAQQALYELAGRLTAQGRTAEAAGLARRLTRDLSPAERVRLAPALATLQVAAEGVPVARTTLESALREAELLARDMGGRRLALADPRAPILDALKQLPEKGSAPPPPQPSSGPAFPVHSRLLVEGKPLKGIAVALVPLQAMTQHLPHPVATGLMVPRAAGTSAEPEDDRRGRGRRRNNRNSSWELSGIVSTLRQNPALVARSDAEGNLSWAAVPPGVYGVVLRAGAWQLPHEGRELAVVPLSAPVAVHGGGAVVPDIHLNAPVRITLVAGDRRPPGLQWNPVKGAVSYRVTLSTLAPYAGGSLEQARGLASPALDPEVVWWRDDLKGTSIRLTPDHFAGPPEDPRRSGLHEWAGYRWSVEARNAAGKVIATGETLARQPEQKLPAWPALRPTATAAGGSPPVARRARFVPTYFQDNRQEFSSPFLDYLLQDEEAPVTAAQPALYPTSPTRGQGLPPRAALAVLPAAPPGAIGGVPGLGAFPGAPGSLPPGACPPFPVGMRPGGGIPAGFPAAPPGLPSLPPGALASHPALLKASGSPERGAGEALRTIPVLVEEFDATCPTRWQADRELSTRPTSEGLPVSAPLVLTSRDTPLPLPAGPGRLIVRLSSLAAEVKAVLRNSQGKLVRLKLLADARTGTLSAPLALGEWRLESLEIRPTAGEVVLERLLVEAPAAAGLYARAWREGAAAWVEITSLSAEPQPVTLGEPGAATPSLDLAPRGKARFPIAGNASGTVTLRSSGRQQVVPVRGLAPE